MTCQYPTPKASFEHEYGIKKSRFISRIHPIDNRQQAMSFLQQAKQDYPDARHHCWAYLLGSPKQPASQASNDDGEPAGTAGKPILNVLNHGDIGDVMVIIIRYFGGIKLGAGGLVRAYASATQQGLEQIETRQKFIMNKLKLHCDFALEDQCRRFISQYQGQIAQADYQQQLTLEINFPVVHQQALQDFCSAHRSIYCEVMG